MPAVSPPAPEPPQHVRFRRTKRILRYMPRRAVFHTYPIIGRFAASARQRAFLWSFKSSHVRPAFYAGSILSLLPVMGVQLPLALILALVLRANFMVLGGLQFITNPFTAAPIYYATFKLGESVIQTAGIATAIVPPPRPTATTPAAPRQPPELAPAQATTAPESRFSARVGDTINALLIGGAISGAVLGAIFDLVFFGFKRRSKSPPPASASTPPPGPPV